MQIMNMFQPEMGLSTGLLVDVKQGIKGESNSLFQSLLEANNRASKDEQTSLLEAIANEQSENGESNDGLVSLMALIDAGDVEGELGDLLENLSEEGLLEHLLQQLKEGSSLGEIVDQLDTENLQELLNAYPELEEAYPMLATLVEFSEMESGRKKETVAGEWITKLYDKLYEAKSASKQQEIVPVQDMTFSTKANQPAELTKEMQQALKEIKHLLDSYRANGNLEKTDAVKLTSLLKDWSMMLRQAKGTDIYPQRLQNEFLTKDENELWNKLLQRYERRSFYAGKNIYAQDAKVSRQDVQNWLQQVSGKQGQSEIRAAHYAPHEQVMPMTKMEQYVVHLENTGRVERVGSEFVDKFSNIIRESQFLSKANGRMELNLILKPEHLGHMTVKMTKVNGEMMVKMLVSSQAAKDMLEQNMHQLRHLFSPHQIAVERNEAVSDDEFYFNEQDDQQEEEGQSSEDDNEEQHHENDDNQEDIDFETLFHQVSEEVEI